MNAGFFQQMIERLPDAFIVTNDEGHVSYWSEGARQLFVYSAQEALGKSLGELIHPHDGSHSEVVHDHTGGVTTVLCKRQDGVLIYASCRVSDVPLDNGRASGMLYCYADVTRTQVQFQASLVGARYRELLESTPDAVVIINASGHILFTNSQAEAMFGFDRAELLGEPIEILMPQRLRGGHVHHRASYFDLPRTRSMGAGLDLRARRKSGDEFPVEISLSPLQTEFGMLGMSAIRDVSDRRRIELILKEKNIELELANQAKDRFLATMSHELRTPLNAILGFTSLLLMRLPGPLTNEQDKQLRAVNHSGKHLLALINDLLDLAKIDSGNVNLSLESMSWQTEIHDVVDTLRPSADDKGLSLVVQAPEGDVFVNMDRRLLRQILINLVNNAIKYTTKGGVRITLQLPQGNEGVRLCVEDTGIGMTEVDLEKLFKPFSRVGDQAKGPEGTGLGLHLSQRFMSLLGGRIEVSSEPGVGSRFTLVFPPHQGVANGLTAHTGH